MRKERLSFIAGVGVTFALVVAAVLAVIAAIRMNTLSPVAPTVPQAKPRAEEPTASASCQLSFTVAPLPTHKVCRNYNTCVTVDGEGTNDCSVDADCVPPPLVCSLVISPGSSTILAGSETRQMTASVSGGVPPYTYLWSVTSSRDEKGILSSTTASSSVWTAPGSLAFNQDWAVSVAVMDSLGEKTPAGQCSVSLAFLAARGCNASCDSTNSCSEGFGCSNGVCRNPSCPNENSCACPEVPVTPKVCNDTCTVSGDCPANMACAGGRCRNATCITAESCVCPVPVAPAPAAPAPAPAPVIVATHKTCQNNACVTVNGSGRDTCTSDAACQPKAAPPPIPQAGVSLPTLAVLIGGVGLILFGLLAL